MPSLRSAVAVTTFALAAGLLTGISGSASAAPPAGSTAAPALPPGGSFVATAPRRVFDSRQGSGPLREARVDPFAGTAVDRSSVAAVLVNITVVDAVAPGYVWTGGDNGAVPTATQGNFDRSRPSSTSQLVAYEAGNGLIVDVSQRADVVVDLQGWVTTPEAATRDTYTPVAPVRVGDSRTGAGLTRLGPGAVRRLDVRGRGGLPATVRQVVVTLTTVDTTASTYVTAWSGDGTRPLVSNVNASTGGPVTNKALVPVSADGRIALFNAGGRTDLVVDLVGYVSPSPTGSYYTPLHDGTVHTRQGTRLLDYAGQAVDVGATMDFGAGADAVHAPSVADLAPTTAVWVSYAAVARQRGYLRVTPGDTNPSTSDAALTPGVASSGAGPVGVSASMGQVTVAASTPARLVVDLFGWFRRTATAPARSVLTRQTVQHDWQSRPDTLPTRLPAAFAHAVGGTDPDTGVTTLYAAVDVTHVDRVVWQQEENTSAGVPPQPELVYNASAITSVVSGGGRAYPAVYVLHDGGQVTAFGSNASGELGVTPSAGLDINERVALPEPATAVYAADGVGYAVLASGAVWSWGRADTYQLGRDAGPTPWVPAPVGGLTSPRVIAGDGRLTFAVGADGRTFVWGSPPSGVDLFTVPTVHGGCASATDLEVGRLETAELCTDGTVEVLADADTLPTPFAVPGLGGVVELGPDPNHGLSARLADGTVAVWSGFAGDPARRVGGLVGVVALGGTPETALFTTG